MFFHTLTALTCSTSNLWPCGHCNMAMENAPFGDGSPIQHCHFPPAQVARANLACHATVLAAPAQPARHQPKPMTQNFGRWKLLRICDAFLRFRLTKRLPHKSAKLPTQLSRWSWTLSLLGFVAGDHIPVLPSDFLLDLFMATYIQSKSRAGSAMFQSKTSATNEPKCSHVKHFCETYYFNSLEDFSPV